MACYTVMKWVWNGVIMSRGKTGSTRDSLCTTNQRQALPSKSSTMLAMQASGINNVCFPSQAKFGTCTGVSKPHAPTANSTQTVRKHMLRIKSNHSSTSKIQLRLVDAAGVLQRMLALLKRSCEHRRACNEFRCRDVCPCGCCRSYTAARGALFLPA